MGYNFVLGCFYRNERISSLDGYVGDYDLMWRVT